MKKGRSSKKNETGKPCKSASHPLATQVTTIQSTDKFPFFNEYHDASYIKWHDRRPIISLRDSPTSGKSGTGKGNYILENDLLHEMVIYRIDDGILSAADGNKCDYGIYTETQKLILVELKGGAVNDAVQQMNSTIDQLITDKAIKCDAIHGRIVTSRTPSPNIMQSYTFDLIRRMKKLNGSLCIRTRQLKEKISCL